MQQSIDTINPTVFAYVMSLHHIFSNYHPEAINFKASPSTSKKIRCTEGADDGEHFSNKVFLIQVCTCCFKYIMSLNTGDIRHNVNIRLCCSL